MHIVGMSDRWYFGTQERITDGKTGSGEWFQGIPWTAQTEVWFLWQWKGKENIIQKNKWLRRTYQGLGIREGQVVSALFVLQTNVLFIMPIDFCFLNYYTDI